jgi:hypothetical protein
MGGMAGDQMAGLKQSGCSAEGFKTPGWTSVLILTKSACSWLAGWSGSCRELVMRYGAIHLQVTSSKPGHQWVKVPSNGGRVRISLSGLKADICPSRSQLRQVSLGHRAGNSACWQNSALPVDSVWGSSFWLCSLQNPPTVPPGQVTHSCQKTPGRQQSLRSSVSNPVFLESSDSLRIDSFSLPLPLPFVISFWTHHYLNFFIYLLIHLFSGPYHYYHLSSLKTETLSMPGT